MPDGHGIRIRDWRIESWRSPICSAKPIPATLAPSGCGASVKLFRADITRANCSHAVPGDAKADEIKAQLGARALPEQLFVGSGLRLTHEPSGASLEFGALGSLRQWHAAALPPVQVLGDAYSRRGICTP